MEVNAAIGLIVGLGNPGPAYEKTRHNIGFWLVTALAGKYNGHLKHETKFRGSFSIINISGHECRLLMPTTYMNLSGEAVRKVAVFYKIPPEAILVVHDELDFPPGAVRMKQGGSANGHNGVQNIIDQLSDNNFWRLRIGIGKPAMPTDMVDYVTSVPSKSDTKQINEAIELATTIIPDLVAGSFAKAIQTLHTTTQIKSQ